MSAVALPRTRTASAAARLALVGASWMAAGALLGLCLAITLPYLVGVKALTVLSGSMEPTIHVGDVVLVRPISPTAARVGDVVTFRDPVERDKLITHRVRRISISGQSVSFVTKGDANTGVEEWQVPRTGTVGLVLTRVPKLGFALFYARGPLGRLLLVVFPALLLGAYELWRVWRPVSGPRGEGPQPGTEGAADA
jgi:signal peptidase